MIKVKSIASSVNNDGIRIDTLEMEYPRFIHSQFLTHRMFSRSSSSSRAIPVSKTSQMPIVTPSYWGRNRPGMQAVEELGDPEREIAETAWYAAAKSAQEAAKRLADLGVHKQITNRILEPFQTIRTVVTATEWQNFFNLRLHDDAQPEIQKLAQAMEQALKDAAPAELKPGQWHTPYAGPEVPEVHRKMVSAARCARVSYLKHDSTKPSLDDDLGLAGELMDAKHWSPFEHQATPMKEVYGIWAVPLGITHQDREENFWSNNFCGWVQHRATFHG